MAAQVPQKLNKAAQTITSKISSSSGNELPTIHRYGLNLTRTSSQYSKFLCCTELIDKPLVVSIDNFPFNNSIRAGDVIFKINGVEAHYSKFRTWDYPVINQSGTVVEILRYDNSSLTDSCFKQIKITL